MAGSDSSSQLEAVDIPDGEKGNQGRQDGRESNTGEMKRVFKFHSKKIRWIDGNTTHIIIKE